MELTPTTIVPFIRNQFPAFYNEEGEQFIAFVEAYYEWVSQTQDRQVIANRDIDLTPDAFISHFKSAYLPDITFDTATDKKLLVKNALNIYRSKGTPRGINLLMKLVYGAPASVVFPRDVLFSPSVNEWFQPLYFEVTQSTRSADLQGKVVTGSRSGATAYVESYVQRRTPTDQINVLMITNIIGNFLTGEALYNGSTFNDSPIIVGSPFSATIVNGGLNFTKYQVVAFSSTRGAYGLAKVLTVDSAGTILTVKIIESGIGFQDGETVNITYDLGTTGATMKLKTYSLGQKLGISSGPTLEQTHFHDNDYYQEYSYEIQSSIPFNKYSSMMNEVMHAAGTRMFGSLSIQEDTLVVAANANAESVYNETSPTTMLNFSLPADSGYLALLY
jgi:hypothetical protein